MMTDKEQPTQEALDKLKARKHWAMCSDLQRWTKHRIHEVKAKRKERRKYDR